MALSIIPVNKVFGKYDQQTRMAELNRKNPVKTIQNQVDRVTISSEAHKKRAISAALSVIQNTNQVSVEANPDSGKNVEPVSYADRVVHNGLEKFHEAEVKKQEETQSQANHVRKNFLKKSREIVAQAEAEANARKKEQADKEATPF